MFWSVYYSEIGDDDILAVTHEDASEYQFKY